MGSTDISKDAYFRVDYDKKKFTSLSLTVAEKIAFKVTKFPKMLNSETLKRRSS